MKGFSATVFSAGIFAAVMSGLYWIMIALAANSPAIQKRVTHARNLMEIMFLLAIVCLFSGFSLALLDHALSRRSRKC